MPVVTCLLFNAMMAVTRFCSLPGGEVALPCQVLSEVNFGDQQSSGGVLKVNTRLRYESWETLLGLAYKVCI